MPYHYRPRRCRWCKESFTPEREKQVTHKHCEEPYALKVAGKLAQDRAKADRAETRAKLARLDKLPKLIAAAQREFNAYIRARDKDRPCICCGRIASDKDLLTGSRWDAGHYRSTGSAPHLRFHEDNCHRQLVYCNRHGAGRAVDYRLGLVARIGLSRVEDLEADNRTHKWTREELIEIATTYRAKTRELLRKEGE